MPGSPAELISVPMINGKLEKRHIIMQYGPCSIPQLGNSVLKTIGCGEGQREGRGDTGSVK